jgi:hypothetical protein
MSAVGGFVTFPRVNQPLLRSFSGLGSGTENKASAVTDLPDQHSGDVASGLDQMFA